MWCFAKKSLDESCRMGSRIVLMKLICSLGYCECDAHTVHKLSQRRLTANWLVPRESDCSQMHSKVSSDWLPSYIKAPRPVLDIFKMAGYFPDNPRVYLLFYVFHVDFQLFTHPIFSSVTLLSFTLLFFHHIIPLLS